MADFFFKSTDSEQERRTKLNMLVGAVADSQGSPGTSITSLNRTGGDGSPGTVDTYTLGMSDGSTFSFDVYNGFDGTDGINGVDGNSIESIVLTSGDGSPGTTDVYTITYTKTSPTTFNVYNGLDGTGTGDMLASNNLSDLVDKVIARTNLDVYSTTDVDFMVNQNSEAIANLATSQGTFTDDGTDISLTVAEQNVPFSVDVQSTNTDVFELNDATDSITFKQDGSFNFSTDMTFYFNTSNQRIVTIRGRNVADDSLIYSRTLTLDEKTGDVDTVYSNLLITPGSNGFPLVPFDMYFTVSIDDDAPSIDIASFSSMLIAMNYGGSQVDEAPIDGRAYARKDASWVEAVELVTTTTPILSGPTVVNEATSIDIIIDNYSSTATYTVTSITGTTTISGDTITFTADDVSADTAGSVSVSAKEFLENESLTATHNLTVIDVPIIADQALVYDSASMTEFSVLSGVSLTDSNTTLSGDLIDKANIVSASDVDILYTASEVVNGDTINVDGIDTAVSVLGTVDSFVSSIDPFADGSLLAKYEMEASANDTVSTNDMVPTDITYASGRFGNSAIFNGATSKIDFNPVATLISNNSHVYSLSMFIKLPTYSSLQYILNCENLIGMSIEHIDINTIEIRLNDDGSSWETSIITTNISENTWFHLVYTEDASGNNVYINGTNVKSSAKRSLYDGGYGTWLGANRTGDASWFSGEIDQLEVYSRVLNNTEVSLLYTQDSKKYKVDTTSVTAGAIPSTAYINERRALSNIVTQDAADADFIGLQSVTSSFDFVTISDFDSSADTIVTRIEVVDGDVITLLLDDLITYVDVVASGVVVDTGVTPNTYTINVASATNGEVPTRAFLSGARTYFEIEDGVFNESPKLSDSKSFTDEYSNFSIVTYTGNGATQDIVTGIGSVDFSVSGNGSGYWLDRSTFEVKNDAGTVVTSGTAIVNTSKVHIKGRSVAYHNVVYDGIRGTTPIYTNKTDAEAVSQGITSYNNDGVSIDTSTVLNEDLATYVLYQTLYTHVSWGTTTQGMKYIEAYNPITKDNIIIYEGNSSNNDLPVSVGKLSQADIKSLSSVVSWASLCEYTDGYMSLDTDAANATSSLSLQSAATDTSVNLLSSTLANSSGDIYVMYGKAKSRNWTIVEYIGTGAAGNSVETVDAYGVPRKPARVITKAVSTTGHWLVVDNKRGNQTRIFLSLADAESVYDSLDITTNGFVSTGGDANVNTAEVRYVALVEFDTNADGGGSFIPSVLSSDFVLDDITSLVSSRTLRTKQSMTASSKLKSLSATIMKTA